MPQARSGRDTDAPVQRDPRVGSDMDGEDVPPLDRQLVRKRLGECMRLLRRFRLRGSRLPHALRRFERTASFDLPEDRENQRRVNLLQRHSAEVRENLVLQAFQDVGGMDGNPPRGLHFVPFASD